MDYYESIMDEVYRAIVSLGGRVSYSELASRFSSRGIGELTLSLVLNDLIRRGLIKASQNEFKVVSSYTPPIPLSIELSGGVYRGFDGYLRFLSEGPYSITGLASTLSPQYPLPSQSFHVKTSYTLYPFQKRILDGLAGDCLILGLPTGLGKTYIAGSLLERESRIKPLRILFLVPSVPLGIQQAIFARRMLNVEAYFISGNISPEKRSMLRVWNAGFAVTTPQTFYNDILSPFKSVLDSVRHGFLNDLSTFFREVDFSFPYDVVVADECQNYIGETDGYSILLAAKACGSRIIALSAAPQLHSKRRFEELKKIFSTITVVSLEDSELKQYIPRRVLKIFRVKVSDDLLKIYGEIGKVVSKYEGEVIDRYGRNHLNTGCREHRECVVLTALRSLRFRLVEDGASSVLSYATWRIRELRTPLDSLNGLSIYKAYREALRREFNHKFSYVRQILKSEEYSKAIVFLESVEAAKQLFSMVQDDHGFGNVSILVGKQNMSMEQQALALLHFREDAKILISTSVGEEGLDIPSADVEVWIDPPSNPRKWIQRFGRVLRQPGGKDYATTYVLVTMGTHEWMKLLSTMRKVERVYGFTQEKVFINDVKAQKSLNI